MEGLRIGIVGTRGIPNHYGGFEQFAEQLSVALVARGHQVWVYNSTSNPCRDAEWRGVRRVVCRDPEDRIGAPGQFLYDLACITDARRRRFDVVLQLGYTSNSVWHWLLPRRAAIVTNMDGMEWQRSKYGAAARWFLRRAERWAVRSSDALVADSEPIAAYLAHRYGLEASYISYPAELVPDADAGLLAHFGVTPGGYYLAIARMQSDNHVAEIIRGAAAAGRPLVVVGNTANAYGQALRRDFEGAAVRFTGGVYSKPALDALRRHCAGYFHGHSAGGTNPSLLEAMACQASVAAHRNPFNQAVLGSDAEYFETPDDVARIVAEGLFDRRREEKTANNTLKIKQKHNLDLIVGQYVELFERTLARKRGTR